MTDVAQASCSSGQPRNCAIGVIDAVFKVFFASYQPESRDQGDRSVAYFTYPPTTEKTVRQRLTTELEAGKWQDVGHFPLNGANHTVQYFNAGTYHQLRVQ